MTDRVKVLTIVLEKDIREDDCEYIINAILLIKGVDSVEKHIKHSNDSNDYIIKRRAMDKLESELLDTLSDIKEKI